MYLKEMGILKNSLRVFVGLLSVGVAVFVLKDISLTESNKGIPAKHTSASSDNVIRTVENETMGAKPNFDVDEYDNQEDIENSEAFDKDCDERFNVTLEGNLKVIENYPRVAADQYMWKIGANLSEPISRLRVPVLVTAVSRNHFTLLLGMLKSFHSVVMNFRQKDERPNIIIYDMGMSRKQKQNILKSRTPCEIREFPFEEFPQHVKTIKIKAWKPILIQMLLMEFGFVWWVDTSVRFKTLNVDKGFEEAKRNGLVFTISAEGKSQSLTKQTDINTFKYLGEDMCKFKQFAKADANSVIVSFNPVSTAIVRAWARCALDKSCIAPMDTGRLSSSFCDVRNTKNSKDGQCHNFDQSVFSILTRRVYHGQSIYSFNKVSEEIVMINRTDRIDKSTCKKNVCFI